jgi:hypothetical protein
VRSLLACLIACMMACGRTPSNVPGDADLGPDADRNLPPVANAGLDAEHMVDLAFALDGSASMDPDGTIVSYQWSVDARPADSTAALVNELTAIASFTPEEVGTYTFRLLVTDDAGATDHDIVTIVVPRLSVYAGPDQTVVWKSTVQLAGSYVSDSTPTTLAWKFLARPSTSTAVLQAPSTTAPTFTADKVGTFVVELAVTSPAGTVADSVEVTVVPPPPDLIDGNIVDIDIGYAGRLVIASINPSRIRVLTPVFSIPPEEMEIPLSVTPTAIGVSETGEFVSIIHDGTRLTRARIPSLQQLNTIDTHTTLLDVRHGTARPHAYPAQAGPLLLIDYTDENIYQGGLVSGPARGRQAPSASYPLYLIELGGSAKLRRYDAGPQTTPFVRDWPYAAGQYPLGSDLWFVGDSLIVTSLGHVFRMSDDPALDMTHRALLDGDQPFEVVGITWGNNQIVTLNTRITVPLEEPETQVRFYDYTTLALQHVVPLPDLVVGGVARATRGLAITNAPFDASHVFVVGAAGTTTALFTVPTP